MYVSEVALQSQEQSPDCSQVGEWTREQEMGQEEVTWMQISLLLEFCNKQDVLKTEEFPCERACSLFVEELQRLQGHL